MIVLFPLVAGIALLVRAKLGSPVLFRQVRPGLHGTGVFDKKTAAEILAEGIRRGLISEQYRGNYPQNVWAVTENGQPMEAQLENEVQGIYHGYPMSKTDPFQEQVMEQWRRST